MANTIKSIQTKQGNVPIDYESLANAPVSDTTLTISGGFGDAKVIGEKIAKLQELVNQATSLKADINAALEEAKQYTDKAVDKLKNDSPVTEI